MDAAFVTSGGKGAAGGGEAAGADNRCELKKDRNLSTTTKLPVVGRRETDSVPRVTRPANRSLINDRAHAADQAPDLSQRIRDGLLCPPNRFAGEPSISALSASQLGSAHRIRVIVNP
jgi:hypothetical protein